MIKIIIICIFLSDLALANPINEIPYKLNNGYYNFFIEIPAGTKQKWEVNKDSGLLEWEEKNGKKRIVKFLSYPGNYGFIPQTFGGDGDPLDVIDLDESKSRGSIVEVKIIGGIYFKDKKKSDIKLIATGGSGIYKNINSIDELLLNKTQVINIIREWFMSYKKPGKMVFLRYINQNEISDIIEESHLNWKKYHETVNCENAYDC